MSNPATDPHTFEASPKVAQEVSQAQIVIQNGVGYDTFMNKIEGSAPSSKRSVIDVQHLLGLPDSTPNPHLWYKSQTMSRVATAIAADLSRVDPSHASYFRANVRTFDKSLNPWYQALAGIRSAFPNAPVATTEPVADYMLQAAGLDNLTPYAMQLNVMNGVDPSPQDVALEDSLFTQHRVKVFLYNRQVTDALTQTFLSTAQHSGIPVVGVYETMPTPGYDYQSWMVAEVHAVRQALVNKTSTQKL
jgi:zinc/manganese transport system substrate-binding protein